MKKYKKYFPVGVKLAVRIGLSILALALAVVCLFDSLSDTKLPQPTIHIISIVGMTLISCGGLLYPLIQDVFCACREHTAQPVFAWEHDIPFTDREELLKETLKEIAAKIADDSDYLLKNMRFVPKNGKKSFAIKLCMKLQEIKHRREKLDYFPKEVARKIGNIFWVKYSPPMITFEMQLKSTFSCVRGKKNIIVIVNTSGEPLLECDQLTDRNVFLVILNFDRKSNDVLLFSDDKILELLKTLKAAPAYAPLCEGKTEDELQKMATKLGTLAHNNIGELVELLSSKDFCLLMETDQTFMKFYRELKAARYKEAEKQYARISAPSIDNLPFKYKLNFEHANLSHFLGRYGEAYTELETLIANISLHPEFMGSALGKMLYGDTILLQSHVLKHQGEFDRAAAKLNEVGKDQQGLAWMRSHFSVNIFQLNEMDVDSCEYRHLLTDLYQLMKTFEEKRSLKDSDYYYYEAFYPIVAFYRADFDHRIISSLIEVEEKAIYYYKENEQRYVTNCYFIKAELLRISQRWKEAEQFYQDCYIIYNFNGDKDILYLVAITCKCIELFDEQPMDFGCNFDAAIEECKQQDGYGFHRRLISEMELAQQNPEFRAKWLPRYRRTINPIP